MKYETNLYQGDCLEVMPELGEKSFDLILTDPPYQVTQCEWDKMIPFENHFVIGTKIYYKDEYILHMLRKNCGLPIERLEKNFDDYCIPGMWENIKRVLKPGGTVALFGSQPFTSKLVMSNLGWFKYEWIWEKNYGSNFLSTKYQPFKEHEQILIFYKERGKYNPQKIKRTYESLKRYADGVIGRQKPSKKRPIHDITGFKRKIEDRFFSDDGMRNPRSIITVNINQYGNKHPTQKPTALLEYLIRTYTDQGDRVLDFCMGSGSIGVACQNTGRHFTGIELEEKFYKIARQRMRENTRLLVMP